MAGRISKKIKKGENEVKEETQNKKFVNPLLAEEVDEKEYGKPKVTGAISNDVIPEHHIENMELDMDGLKDNPQAIEKEEAEEPANKPTRKRRTYDENPVDEPKEVLPSNKSFTELPKADQKRGAEQFADMVLGLYQWLHELAKNGLILDEEKLKKKALKRKFDMRALNVKLPMSEPDENGNYEVMTLKAFLDDYNENITETLTIKDEWIEEVRPVLVRVLTKNGWAMTDEQFLLYKIGEDIVKKTATIFSLSQTQKQVLKASMSFIGSNPNFAEVKRDLDKKNIEQQREIEELKKELDKREGKLTNTDEPVITEENKKIKKVKIEIDEEPVEPEEVQEVEEIIEE